MAEPVYLDRADIEGILGTLVERLLPDYDDPPATFTLLGGEGRGGALLDSALAQPKQPYYETLHQKAATLLRSLVKNHPFIDGNKRAAVAVTLVFLLVNGQVLVASQDELVEFAVYVAQSSDPSVEDLSVWLQSQSVALQDVTAKTIEEVENRDLDASAVIERLELLKQYGRPPAADA